MKFLALIAVLTLIVIAYKMPTAEQIGTEVMEAPRREQARIDQARFERQKKELAAEEKLRRADEKRKAAAARMERAHEAEMVRLAAKARAEELAPKPTPDPAVAAAEIARKYGAGR